MRAYLAQLTNVLRRSTSTILRERKRGKVRIGEWEREWGSHEDSCIMSGIFYLYGF